MISTLYSAPLPSLKVDWEFEEAKYITANHWQSIVRTSHPLDKTKDVNILA